MAALTKPKMTVEEFLAWAEGQPGRYELFRGEIYAMSPETVGHAESKAVVYAALAAGIRQRHLPCHALPDGVTVQIDDETAYEPDALVYCGDKLAPSALEVPNPVIIVEVLLPSTRRVDASLKLALLPATERCALFDCRPQSAVHPSPFARHGRHHPYAHRHRRQYLA